MESATSSSFTASPRRQSQPMRPQAQSGKRKRQELIQRREDKRRAVKSHLVTSQDTQTALEAELLARQNLQRLRESEDFPTPKKFLREQVDVHQAILVLDQSFRRSDRQRPGVGRVPEQDMDDSLLQDVLTALVHFDVATPRPHPTHEILEISCLQRERKTQNRSPPRSDQGRRGGFRYKAVCLAANPRLATACKRRALCTLCGGCRATDSQGLSMWAHEHCICDTRVELKISHLRSHPQWRCLLGSPEDHNLSFGAKVTGVCRANVCCGACGGCRARGDVMTRSRTVRLGSLVGEHCVCEGRLKEKEAMVGWLITEWDTADTPQSEQLG
eukprot:c15500_g1_i1.p1 GENE.c15500_g1_i1~~c15500_g1_i1.p1  ORF type:complete len:330 (+),score=47.00 c15500_g1_i1:90-1079(+)